MRPPFRLGHLCTQRVNCSKFLFLLFHLISTNIANWNKCKCIYCKKFMQIIIDKKYNQLIHTKVMCICHIIKLIIFVITVFLIIIACQHISNFLNNCLSVVTNFRCKKSSKKLLLQSAFIDLMCST